MKHQGLKVGEARVRVTTNAPALLEPQRFFWLDTNFLRVDRIPPEKAGDSFLEIWDGGTGPVMEIEDRNLVLRGGFSRLEETVLFKGLLKDAVRLDTFREFFPEWPARLGVDLKAEAGGKLVVDLSERRAADIDRLLEGGLIRKALTWVSGVRDTHKVFDQLSK